MCSVAMAESILSHNPQRITSLAINHVKFHRGHREVARWASVVKSVLPTVTSLSFCKPGAPSTGSATEEHGAFTELAAVLESLQQFDRHIHIGSTLESQYCFAPGASPPSQKSFEIWCCLCACVPASRRFRPHQLLPANKPDCGNGLRVSGVGCDLLEGI